MRIRRIAHLAAALALLVAGTLPVAEARAQSGEPRGHSEIVIFDTAEFVESKSTLPPADTATWEPVTLPDDWRRLGHNNRGVQGWYRIKFALPKVPPRPSAIYIRHLRSNQLDLHINSVLLGGSRDLWGPLAQGTGYPIFLTVPPALLRAGDNTLHIRMRARPLSNPRAGLGRVTFGDASAVRKAQANETRLTSDNHRLFFGAMLTAGVIALFLWSARRSEAVMLWFSIMCLSWAFAQGTNLYAPWTEWTTLVRSMQQFTNHGLPALAVIVCLRSVGLRWPRFEVLLWGHLLFLLAYPLWRGTEYTAWGWTYLRAAGPLLALAGALIVFRAAQRPLRWSYRIEIVAMLAMGVMMSFDLARGFNLIPLDSHNVRIFHVPLLLLTLGTVIFERHVAAIWRMRQSNIELERRVAEKAREIESYHAERDEVMRQQTLAHERQRILADMHDGLGASLVALLRHVQSKQLDAQVERRVREALQELRIAIDALEPSGGDLGAVLGNLRYRLEPLLDPAGVRIEWEVGELPPIDALEPSAVFALQRIVLEAVANALKHSGATRVRISAQAAPGGGVEIRVEDDGRGFDASSPAAGLGLTNMRARASRIGAKLDISSRAGDGTVARLQIPQSLARLSEDKASGKPDPRVLHDLAPAAGVA
jgi:signal transduction histidine kinase